MILLDFLLRRELGVTHTLLTTFEISVAIQTFSMLKLQETLKEDWMKK